jgi:transposase InsO family protein
MGPRATAELADGAPGTAIARRRPAGGRIHHSDHGAQYVSLLLGKTMRDNDIRPSMGSMPPPWDNATAESLMGVIKSECVHARTFESRGQATLALFEYMERFHDRLRIHSALGWLSPAGFEAANEPRDRSSAA